MSSYYGENSQSLSQPQYFYQVIKGRISSYKIRCLVLSKDDSFKAVTHGKIGRDEGLSELLM